MNNVRNALTVLIKVCSLITITRSVSGIYQHSTLSSNNSMSKLVYIFKNTIFGVFCCSLGLIIYVAHACCGTTGCMM